METGQAPGKWRQGGTTASVILIALWHLEACYARVSIQPSQSISSVIHTKSTNDVPGAWCPGRGGKALLWCGRGGSLRTETMAEDLRRLPGQHWTSDKQAGEYMRQGLAFQLHP